MGYINQKTDTTNADEDYATAVGGVLKYETLPYRGVHFGVAAYISQKIHDLSGEHKKGELNPDFFDEEGNSFAYIGEAYANFRQDALNIRIGRQLLDTPLADTDDIRMHLNTFLAAVAVYDGLEATEVRAGYITRWAGFDSGDDISEFKKAAGPEGEGTVVLGVTNTAVENLALRGWYYESDKLMRAVYADAVYSTALSDAFELEAGVQVVDFSEKASSDVAGSVSD